MVLYDWKRLAYESVIGYMTPARMQITETYPWNWPAYILNILIKLSANSIYQLS